MVNVKKGSASWAPLRHQSSEDDMEDEVFDSQELPRVLKTLVVCGGKSYV